MGRVALPIAAAAAWLGAASIAPGELPAQGIPPHLSYRTIETANFRVTFASELQELGWTAARIAETAHAALREDFLPAPAGRIDVLLTDHSDLSDGFAEVFPSKRIVVWAQPPVDGLALSHFEEWLELVITHELVHIFHLDHAGVLGNTVRGVLGRVPWTWPAFPAYTASLLGIEGVAVHQESLRTGAGRVHGSMHESIARTQVIEGHPESVDQGLGDSPIWPGGDRPYVFGSLFFRYLSETYGEPSLVRFLEALADQWIPYRLDAASRDTFGVSFEALWTRWMSSVESEARNLESRISRGKAPVGPALLTEGARQAFYPVPSPSGARVVYARADGVSDSQLVLLEGDGSHALTRWNSLERASWLSETELLVPQVEYVDTYHVRRDLYRVGLDGTAARLTHGLRVVHADPHPRRGEIVAAIADEGANRLVVLSMEGDLLRVLRGIESGVLWSYPTWSPDGTRIAAIRRTPDGSSAVLVLGPDGEEQMEIIEDRSVNTAPAWSPDGSALLWSSDRTGVANLYAGSLSDPMDLGSAAPRSIMVRQVTDLRTAGTFPAVDQAAEWIYLSVLSDDGWEIGRLPYDPEGWFEPLTPDPRFAAVSDEVRTANAFATELGASTPTAVGLMGAELGEYSALSTLIPRYWLPIRIESESAMRREVLPAAWGARTSGYDLVRRHEYDLRVATVLGADRSRTEWDASYAWAGLGNPTVFAETGQEWRSGGALVVSDSGTMAVPDTVLPVLRERWIGWGMRVLRRRARVTSSASLGARLISQGRELLDLEGEPSLRVVPLRPSSRLAELRLSAVVSTARSYPFSISTENGLQASVTVRERWDRSVPDSLVGRSGADGALREGVVSLRGFRGVGGPGYSNHVLAFRATVGLADGPGAGAGHFGIGGGTGDGGGLLGFSIGTASRHFPIRGVSSGSERGSKAWSFTGEWRFPVALVHRGIGAWPLHLDRAAGSLFIDVGGTGRNVEGSVRWSSMSSAGMELMLFGSLFFEELDRLRLGVAFPLESPPGTPRTATFYAQTGWSF